MYVLDLFSGIGGFSLGLEHSGLRTVAFCEIDPYSRAVLGRHWPGIPIHTDIRQLDGIPYRGKIDLICGGYPCQPFSVAGKQRGAADQRHLWPEMHRLVQEIRPRWVVAENVAGHIKLGFDEVAASLEAEGYTVWPFVIPASAVNAPHRRDRLWILAHADRTNARPTRDCAATGLIRTTTLQTPRQGRNGSAVFDCGLSDLPQLSADTDGNGLQGSQQQLPSDQGRQGQLLALLSAFSPAAAGTDELPTPILCGKNDGVSHRAYRLRCLGNSIVPQIAALIGQAITRYDLNLYGYTE